MSQPTEQRPPQVTLASGIVMFASFVVLLTAIERVTTLGSLETQQSIRDVLGESPFSSLGLDLDFLHSDPLGPGQHDFYLGFRAGTTRLAELQAGLAEVHFSSRVLASFALDPGGRP